MLKEKVLVTNSVLIKDIELLKSQDERCKEILLSFSKNPQNLKDNFFEKIRIIDLIKLNFEKFNDNKKVEKTGVVIDKKTDSKVIIYRLIVIVIFSFSTIFFWWAFEQAGGSMTIYASDYTDRNLIGQGAFIFKVFNVSDLVLYFENEYDFNSNPKSILGKIFFSRIEEISKLLIIVRFLNPLSFIDE